MDGDPVGSPLQQVADPECVRDECIVAAAGRSVVDPDGTEAVETVEMEQQVACFSVVFELPFVEPLVEFVGAELFRIHREEGVSDPARPLKFQLQIAGDGGAGNEFRLLELRCRNRIDRLFSAAQFPGAVK